MLRKKKTFKSAISLLLVTLLMFSCFPITASAKTKVTSIEIEPITMIEYTNGYFDCDYNEVTDDYDLEYYRYWPEDVMEYTITFSDGTVISEYGNGFDYKGDWCYLDIETDQSYENEWKAGNTYTITASFGGVYTDVDVTIIETPLESIQIKPVELIEKYDGYIDADYNEKTDEFDLEYFRYELDNYFQYTATFKDGSVESEISDSVYYNDEYFNFEVVTDQSYYNQWTEGNTYTAKVYIMGVIADVNVTITKSPVKNITVEPVTVYQYVDSFVEVEYDLDTDEYIGEYDCYLYDEKINFTVEWKDGTKSSYTYLDYIEYNDMYCYPYTYDNQSYDTPWKTGKKYTATLDVFGYEAEIPVTVKENPVSRIELVKDPYDESYVLGEVINPNGAVLRVRYKDGTSEEITLDNLSLCDVNSIYLEKFEKYVELYFYGDIAYDGYHSFSIYFLGKELLVAIDLIESYPSKVAISGKGIDLGVEITLDNGEKIKANSISFEPWYAEAVGEQEIVRGALYTDAGVFVIDIYEDLETGDFCINMVVFTEFDETVIEANTLKASDCQWLVLQEKNSNLLTAIITQCDYMNKYDGNVTKSNIDELISIACLGSDIYWSEDVIIDFDEERMIMRADFVEDAFEDVFGFAPDLTLSSYYDKSNEGVSVSIDTFNMVYIKHPMSVEKTSDGIVVSSTGYRELGIEAVTIEYDENLKVVGFEITRDDTFMSGDVNGDGVLSIIDATEIQKYLAGLVEFTDAEMVAADYNGDGLVSIIDATDIQKVLAGLV